MKAYTVLLVDDIRFNLLVAQRTLEQAGLYVKTAQSALEGLSILKDTPDFDLVITDLAMPKMDGVQFIQEAKNIVYNTPQGQIKAPPFVLLTAIQDPQELLRAGRAGFVDILAKPLNSERLLGILKSLKQDDPQPRAEKFQDGVVSTDSAIVSEQTTSDLSPATQTTSTNNDEPPDLLDVLSDKVSSIINDTDEITALMYCQQLTNLQQQLAKFLEQQGMSS